MLHRLLADAVVVLHLVLYPAALTRELQWALGGLVIAVNAAVYAVVLLGRRSRLVS
jgi:hypothetical protein